MVLSLSLELVCILDEVINFMFNFFLLYEFDFFVGVEGEGEGGR